MKTSSAPLSESDRDFHLVQQIAAGHENALRELCATHGQRLFAYAMRITGNPAVAEDVVQESLVAVWQGARRFRGESRVLAWMLRIVHHKALNALRGRSPVALEQAESIVDESPTPDEQLAVSERRRLLSAGLERLSWEHRTALELVFYQGMSLSETAQICDCPVGTIKSRLSYAKSKLRDDFERQGLALEDMV